MYNGVVVTIIANLKSMYADAKQIDDVCRAQREKMGFDYVTIALPIVCIGEAVLIGTESRARCQLV